MVVLALKGVSTVTQEQFPSRGTTCQLFCCFWLQILQKNKFSKTEIRAGYHDEVVGGRVGFTGDDFGKVWTCSDLGGSLHGRQLPQNEISKKCTIWKMKTCIFCLSKYHHEELYEWRCASSDSWGSGRTWSDMNRKVVSVHLVTDFEVIRFLKNSKITVLGTRCESSSCRPNQARKLSFTNCYECV